MPKVLILLNKKQCRRTARERCASAVAASAAAAVQRTQVRAMASGFVCWSLGLQGFGFDWFGLNSSLCFHRRAVVIVIAIPALLLDTKLVVLLALLLILCLMTELGLVTLFIALSILSINILLTVTSNL